MSMYKGTPFALQMARPSRGSDRAKNTLTLKVGMHFFGGNITADEVALYSLLLKYCLSLLSPNIYTQILQTGLYTFP